MSKKTENGMMLAVVIGLVGLILSIVAVVAVSYISAFNAGNMYENKLKAERENNRNVLAQYGQKVMEAAQVPTMMRDDIEKVTRAAIEGRYGEDGARAAFQMITESNPQIQDTVYVKIQQVIEAGRDEFKTGQMRMIDTRRAYETALGSFWQGMWLRVAGYPKLTLSEFDIISTARADAAYEKGREDGPIQLR